MRKKIRLNEEGYRLYYLLAEYETVEKACQFFKKYEPEMKFCPHLVRADLLRGENLILYLYALPQAQKWWVEASVENPSLAGAVKVTLHEVEDFLEEEVSIEWGTYQSPPCGSECLDCPFYKDRRCTGCPVVTGFKKINTCL